MRAIVYTRGRKRDGSRVQDLGITKSNRRAMRTEKMSARSQGTSSAYTRVHASSSYLFRVVCFTIASASLQATTENVSSFVHGVSAQVSDVVMDAT